MNRSGLYRIVAAGLFVMAAALAQAQGPAARPGKVTGPIVGVGRSQPLTPEQQTEEQRGQIKSLLDQFAGDEANAREFAQTQLLRIGKPALPQAQAAADTKNLPQALGHRYAILLKTLRADADRRPAIEKYVKDKGIGRGELIPISDAALQKEFPDLLFYALRFRQFPIAFEVPPGMKPSNVLAVSADGTVTPINDSAAFTAVFQKHAPAVKALEDAEQAIAAFLRIAEEWHQDGFYRFEIPDQSLEAEKTAEGLLASGKAVIAAGGKGEITGKLAFDAQGKLTQANEQGETREGVRPICQATKLLDPDPIVRGMARQCILTMGWRAQGYLTEQRAKASPPLRAEIDRIWAQIMVEAR